MRLGQRQLPIQMLSATSITKAVACPEAWRRRYLLKEREGFGPDRFLGSVDHATIAAYFSDKKETGSSWDVEQLLSAYKYCWSDGLERSEKDGEPPSWGIVNPESLSNEGMKMVTAYVSDAAASVDPIAIESRFEETIPGIPVPLVGYIDLETRDRIVERKTSKKRVSKPHPGWRFQGRVYQIAQRKPVEWHVTVRKGKPEVLTGTTPGLTMEVGDVDHTVVMVQQAYAMLQTYWERYGSNSPWPTNGTFHDWLCSKCGFGPNFQNSCIAWRYQ